jgi:lactam utilization protein B
MTTTHEETTQIEQRIRSRTGGRVQQVCVQLDDEKVVIHGDAPTYYSMQLAVAAATELFPDREIINAIEVV